VGSDQLPSLKNHNVTGIACPVWRPIRKEEQQMLYYPPGHFYSPIVDPVEAGQHISEIESRQMPETLDGIAIDRAAMRQTWQMILPMIESSPFREKASGEFRYALENPYYSWGDGNVLQAMIRHYRPQRITEIGSGWSSACICDTVHHFLNDAVELTFVEPYPKRLRDLLGNGASKLNISVLECKVQEVNLDIFERLEGGDFLIIDSSHVLRTGGDVCYELFEILPRLASGVVVQIHDIFWPFEYPREWAVNDNRSWNEIYAVRAFLTYNDRWNIVMFNSYMALVERNLVANTYPDFSKRSPGAIWLQRR
jgi:methyltransferase family protein